MCIDTVYVYIECICVYIYIHTTVGGFFLFLVCSIVISSGIFRLPTKAEVAFVFPGQGSQSGAQLAIFEQWTF